MERSTHLELLSPQQCQEHNRLVKRFAQAWQPRDLPNFEQILGEPLPEDPALRVAVLIDLVSMDIEFRQQDGLPVDVLGHYLRNYPEMSPLTEHVRKWLAEEAQGRTASGGDGSLQGKSRAESKRAPEQHALVSKVAAPISAAQGPTFRLVLTVTEGPHLGTRFVFTQHETFVVGRGKKAHFRLPSRDDALSRMHFMVEVNPPQCRVLDMGSSNGTYVNGQRVTVADLHDGDDIQAGVTVLRVTLEEEEGITRKIDLPVPSLGGSTLPEHTGEWQQPTGASRKPYLEGTGGPEAPPVATPVSEQEAGHTFADYLLLRELGSGGMGVVYLAQRLSDNQVVALKTVKPAVQSNEQQLQRFLREAAILDQLKHPHIVTFQEMGEHQGTLFFVMEYVAGTDARKLLEREGPLPVSRAVHLVCQLLEALHYAHEQGFVHRDIKPANMMVVGEPDQERVRLVDFGLARVYQDSPLSGLTVSGQIAGTPAYLAPEQITDLRNVKSQADQYATAATLYELLTNCHAYDFPKQSYQRIAMILQESPVPIRARRPDLPTELAEVIHRGLARESADRFPSAEQMRQALLPFAQ